MTLRQRLIIYILVLHLFVAIGGIIALWNDFKPYILVLELLLVLSLVIGLRITKSFNLHLELVSAGSEFIRERDFSHTFTEVEAEDLNRLVLLYNKMIQNLREERLKVQEQQAFLEKILNTSPMGTIVLDSTGVIVADNLEAQNLFDSAGRPLTGNKISEVSHPLARDLLELESNQSTVATLANRRKIRLTHSQYFDRGMACSFYLMVELTEEFWKTEKDAYNMLIRTLSHEVNNTVGAINSILRSCLTYAVQLNEEDRQDYTTALKVATERTTNLNSFMQSYADVIRLPQPDRSRINLNRLLSRLLPLLESDSTVHDVELVTSFNEEELMILADQAQLEQVLLNVIRNAREAAGSGGMVKIQSGSENHWIFLRVDDNGPGFTNAVQDKLFTPFFSTKEKGQGIGLTLVSEILTRHQFDFRLHRVDDWTRFEILFPKS